MDNMIIIILLCLLTVEIVMCFALINIFRKVESTNKMAVSSLIDQNTELSGQLQQLHLEILSLNHELNILAIENKNLNREVASLSVELQRLQKHIKLDQEHDELSREY